MRYLLLVLLLVGTAWGAVVPDGSQLPPSDPDAPTATLPGPGGAPVKVPAVGPASNPTTGGGTVPSMSTTSLSGGTGGTGGKGGKGAAKPVGNQTVPGPSPAAAEAPRFTLPNGQPVPWSLIALAVLLFMFSVGGGVYFYQSRDE